MDIFQLVFDNFVLMFAIFVFFAIIIILVSCSCYLYDSLPNDAEELEEEEEPKLRIYIEEKKE